jgi:hypothetical protein
VPSVPFWRRLEVSQGYPAHSSQGHLAAVPSHAHAAALRARHWARHWVQPGASARLAPAPLRVARGAKVLRQEAGHAVAARPVLRDAAQGLLREAEAPPAGAAVVQRARDAGALRPEEARDAAALRPEEVPGAAVPQRAAQHVAAAAGLPWAARPSAHLSAAVSVFRQDRVRLELVQRRSERSARATACLRSAAPSTPLRQAARDEGVSYDVSPRKGSEQCKDSSLADGFGIPINSQSLGRIVADDKTQTLFISSAH